MEIVILNKFPFLLFNKIQTQGLKIQVYNTMKKLLIAVVLLAVLSSCDKEKCTPASVNADQTQMEIDIARIDQYLEENNIEAQVHNTGIRYRIIEKGEADADRLIGQLHVLGFGVGDGVNRHGADAQLAAGAQHAQCNLAAVGNEDLVEHAVLSGSQ